MKGLFLAMAMIATCFSFMMATLGIKSATVGEGCDAEAACHHNEQA
jgi:hypothetical protein